jgi:MFS family permease
MSYKKFNTKFSLIFLITWLVLALIPAPFLYGGLLIFYYFLWQYIFYSAPFLLSALLGIIVHCLLSYWLAKYIYRKFFSSDYLDNPTSIHKKFKRHKLIIVLILTLFFSFFFYLLWIVEWLNNSYGHHNFLSQLMIALSKSSIKFIDVFLGSNFLILPILLFIFFYLLINFYFFIKNKINKKY